MICKISDKKRLLQNIKSNSTKYHHKIDCLIPILQTYKKEITDINLLFIESKLINKTVQEKNMEFIEDIRDKLQQGIDAMKESSGKLHTN